MSLIAGSTVPILHDYALTNIRISSSWIATYIRRAYCYLAHSPGWTSKRHDTNIVSRLTSTFRDRQLLFSVFGHVSVIRSVIAPVSLFQSYKRQSLSPFTMITGSWNNSARTHVGRGKKSYHIIIIIIIIFGVALREASTPLKNPADSR